MRQTYDKYKGISLNTKAQESSENYLETIFILSQNGTLVRSVDIAEKLNYTKPSVSVAIKKLRLEGYIEINNGFIFLTENGKRIAESIYEKHVVISNFLIFLGVDRQIAIDDACKIEHVISDQSILAIKKYSEKMEIENS